MAVYLVAISHELNPSGKNDLLMSPACARRFEQEVQPLITDKSLVLIEGLSYNELIRATHPKYQIAYQMLQETLSEKRPTIAGFDNRNILSQRDHDEIAGNYDAWAELVLRIVDIDLSVLPRTLSEAKDMLSRQPSGQLLWQPSSQEKALARWIWSKSQQFDRAYLEALKKYTRHFDAVFFVGGSIHALSLALKSDYRLVDLLTPDEVGQAYHSYIGDYRLPRLFK